MSQAAAVKVRTPAFLETLIHRFDPEVMDLSGEKARIRLVVEDQWIWDLLVRDGQVLASPWEGTPWDAELIADGATWQEITEDPRVGLEAFQTNRLVIRRNMHVGIGFLAATSGIAETERLGFTTVQTPVGGISTASMGEGEAVICLHGLGATKASFMPTLAALSGERRVIGMDFPGFGDSVKPLGAPYDAEWFAESVVGMMDALDIESAHLIGNSMGGRVAIETGLLYPERVRGMTLLAPALAWLRDRRYRWLLQRPLPLLGLFQPAPRVIAEPIVRGLVPGGKDGWTAAGVDEFLRSFLTPRGRVAFYESARNIYLDEPHGEQGLWARLRGLKPPALFVWGRQDTLVPVGFKKHVEQALPSARHLVLQCGHVPQMEQPARTHAAIEQFLDGLAD
jgi:pimeloyl-ACP methyl ester carboxylesterase